MNNNNVHKAQISVNGGVQNELQGSIDQTNPGNVIISDDALQASLEVGWMNEVQELRYAFFSFTLAAAVAILSWYISSSNFMEFTHF